MATTPAATFSGISKVLESDTPSIKPNTIYLVKKDDDTLKIQVSDQAGENLLSLESPDVSFKADLDPVTGLVLNSQLPKSLLGGKAKTITFANALHPHKSIAKWFPVDDDTGLTLTKMSAVISVPSTGDVECVIKINGYLTVAPTCVIPAGGYRSATYSIHLPVIPGDYVEVEIIKAVDGAHLAFKINYE